VIHREHQNKSLNEEDRVRIVDRIFFRQPDHIKKMIRENLPEKFCAIFSFFSLPGGFLAVYRVTGPRDFGIDIFDPGGRFIYQLEIPEKISYRRVRFLGNIVSLTASVDDRHVYREYRVKNLPDIFGN
jgi:hypothetical protein